MFASFDVNAFEIPARTRRGVAVHPAAPAARPARRHRVRSGGAAVEVQAGERRHRRDRRPRRRAARPGRCARRSRRGAGVLGLRAGDRRDRRRGHEVAEAVDVTSPAPAPTRSPTATSRFGWRTSPKAPSSSTSAAAEPSPSKRSPAVLPKRSPLKSDSSTAPFSTFLRARSSFREKRSSNGQVRISSPCSLRTSAASVPMTTSTLSAKIGSQAITPGISAVRRYSNSPRSPYASIGAARPMVCIHSVR